MAREQRRTVGQDEGGRWRQECRDLEDRLGFNAGEIWRQWQQVALLRECESVAPVPRAAHEEMAFLTILEAFDKQGSAGN